MKRILWSFSLVVVLVTSISVSAQVAPGTPAFGSYGGGTLTSLTWAI